MSNSGGFAVTRTHTEDRFYNPPAKELRRPLKDESRVNSVDSLSESRTDLDESTLSAAQSSPEVASLTNLDRLMESVTPLVPAQCFSEAKMRGWRTHEVNLRPYFCLGDLWECFSEWSVYGVGVPLLLNGSDSVKQYYVPSLSGIQLFVDQQRPRASEDSDVESSRETSSAGSSDCETDRRLKGGVVGAREKHNSQGTNKPPTSSFSDEMEVGKSPGHLVFEYFEQEQPHHRKPLYDKATVTGKNQLHSPASSSRKVCGFDASSQISLPVFGLASYKLRGSILTSNCSQEWQQASSLLHAADNWLHGLRVHLPDFQFFVSHNSKRGYRLFNIAVPVAAANNANLRVSKSTCLKRLYSESE
ncbi:hypothetical protein GOBAR_AA16820 [Gossypium barbadense]|uniref:DUF789 domain-containing protein n=1 Tax=Gossypium barbadense TaxID=3634 RepID=A0A2P5XKH7_GOSBA|nr:hypothetical protein GOBAR_AA16820 [Gossypium barbadense]